MANVIEQRGFFWWLNEPDGQTNSKQTSIPGSLIVSEEGHVKLTLDGSLWYSEPLEYASWAEPRFLPDGKWITGQLGVYGGGGYVLLCNVERTDLSVADELPSPQTYEAEICIKRASPFNTDFSLWGFHHLRIELTGLEEWLEPDGIRVDVEHFSEEDVELNIKYRDHKFSYDIGNASISIESLTLGALPSTLYGSPQRVVEIKQIYFLIYTPNDLPNLSTLQYAFTRIEEFFALLLGSYFRLDWPTFVCREDGSESWDTIYFFRGSKREFELNRYFMWTRFRLLEKSFGKMFSAWRTQVEQFGAGYYLYLAAMRNPLPYPEHRFVNLIWALESLHRKRQFKTEETEGVVKENQQRERILGKFMQSDDKADADLLRRLLKYAYEPNLADRMVELFSKLPIQLEPKELRRFSERCASKRNAISHFGGPRDQESYDEFSGDLPDIADALSYLYHAFLLYEIGIDEKILIKNFQTSGLAEIRIRPTLRRVGLNLPEADKEEAELLSHEKMFESGFE